MAVAPGGRERVFAPWHDRRVSRCGGIGTGGEAEEDRWRGVRRERAARRRGGGGIAWRTRWWRRSRGWTGWGCGRRSGGRGAAGGVRGGAPAHAAAVRELGARCAMGRWRRRCGRGPTYRGPGRCIGRWRSTGEARLGTGRWQAGRRGPRRRARVHTLPSIEGETVHVGWSIRRGAGADAIESGDTVSYPDTMTHCAGRVTFGMSVAEREALRDDYPAAPHSNIGPVAVRGAEPGDVIECRILKVDPIDWGYNNSAPGRGTLPGRLRAAAPALFRVRSRADDDGVPAGDRDSAGAVPGHPGRARPAISGAVGPPGP